MNKKLVSLGLVLIALLAAFGSTATTQASDWIEYRAADNSFAVNVPAPFRVTPHQMITPRGPITAPLFTQKEGGNSYFVSYIDLPGNYIATTIPERILDSGITSTLQSQGAKLELKSDLDMNGMPGKGFTGTIRAFSPDGQDAVMHARVYVGNGRLYLVYVTGAASDAQSGLAAQYLDSFRIVSDVASR